MQHRRPDPTFTPEQLRLAYRHLYRPGWPSTVVDALAHPQHGAALRELAPRMARCDVMASTQLTPLQAATRALPVPADPQPRAVVQKVGPNVFALIRPKDTITEQLATRTREQRRRAAEEATA